MLRPVGIALLVLACGLVAFGRSRQSARVYACKSNLKQLGLALHMYATDHDGWFPTIGKTGVANLDALLEKGYIGDPDVLQCPQAEERLVSHYEAGRPRIDDWGKVSYFYTEGINVDRLYEEDPELLEKTIVMGDKSYQHHDWKGRNVLLADGHIAWEEAPYASYIRERERRATNQGIAWGVGIGVAGLLAGYFLGRLTRQRSIQ